MQDVSGVLVRAGIDGNPFLCDFESQKALWENELRSKFIYADKGSTIPLCTWIEAF